MKDVDRAFARNVSLQYEEWLKLHPPESEVAAVRRFVHWMTARAVREKVSVPGVISSIEPPPREEGTRLPPSQRSGLGQDHGKIHETHGESINDRRILRYDETGDVYAITYLAASEGELDLQELPERIKGEVRSYLANTILKPELPSVNVVVAKEPSIPRIPA